MHHTSTRCYESPHLIKKGELVFTTSNNDRILSAEAVVDTNAFTEVDVLMMRLRREGKSMGRDGERWDSRESDWIVW